MAKVRVIISNHQKAVKIPTGVRMLVRRCCNAVLQLEQFPHNAEISVVFIDNDQIQELNREYRGKDMPTDVLSFPQNEMEPGSFNAEECERDYDCGAALLGDMVLSLERCYAQGQEYGHGFERELCYLTVHSVLHLLGYDHLDEGVEKRKMREREELVMERLGL